MIRYKTTTTRPHCFQQKELLKRNGRMSSCRRRYTRVLRTINTMRNSCKNTGCFKKVLCVLVLLTAVYHLVMQRLYTVRLPPDVNILEYPPFEPTILEDFPTVQAETPRIPHVIHQTNFDEMIPSQFQTYVQTCKNINSKWDYFFWTDSSARKLISDKFPRLLSFWDSYWSPEMRADVLKYAVLYEYGGAFVELDFECLRPLDRLTYKYACIFTPEPFEPSAIKKNWPYYITNSLVLCRPKHPFLKTMLDELHNYAVMETISDVAGPSFVTSQFIAYNELQGRFNYSRNYRAESNSPYIYKGEMTETDFNAVYIPNSKYFFNDLDRQSFHLLNLYSACNTDFHKMLFNQRRGCIELSKRDFNNRNEFAFTEYHWQKTYKKLILAIRRIIYGHVNIHSVVRNLKTYDGA